MSEIVLRVQGLSKRFRIGERERYLALRDVLARAFAKPFKLDGARRSVEYLWALNKVSFDVTQGEVVGLIGRNGSGKTTLLKILSRITRPTMGHAEIRGRVGSLLEVGTGFHPELTGRENVYLSGAILGMGRNEIGRKFDEIVTFSGVERFIDTPLKHFSSGMQMRLAFAVAAHLEPEILLVDEVLAVGDLEFQKKCMGKMQDISNTGRTIIFVSHQMTQIRRLCERVFWLDGGVIRQAGLTGEVIAAYEAEMMGKSLKYEQDPSKVFISWQIGLGGNALIDGLKEASFQFVVNPPEAVRRGYFGLHIHNEAGLLVASWGFDGITMDTGTHEVRVTVPQLPLRPGTYTILSSLFNNGNNLTGKMLAIWNAVPFLVVNTTPLGHAEDAWAGILNLPAQLTSMSRTEFKSSNTGYDIDRGANQIK